MNFLLCNFSSIPPILLRWLSHLLFVWGCRGKRSASRVLFRGYSRRGAWSLVSGKDLGWTVSNFLTNSSSIFFYSFYEILLIWLVRIYQNSFAGRGSRIKRWETLQRVFIRDWMGATKIPIYSMRFYILSLVGARPYITMRDALARFNFFYLYKNKTGFKKYIFYFLLFLLFFYFFSVFWILPVQIHLFHEK